MFYAGCIQVRRKKSLFLGYILYLVFCRGVRTQDTRYSGAGGGRSLYLVSRPKSAIQNLSNKNPPLRRVFCGLFLLLQVKNLHTQILSLALRESIECLFRLDVIL